MMPRERAQFFRCCTRACRVVSIRSGRSLTSQVVQIELVGRLPIIGADQFTPVSKRQPPDGVALSTGGFEKLGRRVASVIRHTLLSLPRVCLGNVLIYGVQMLSSVVGLRFATMSRVHKKPASLLYQLGLSMVTC